MRNREREEHYRKYLDRVVDEMVASNHDLKSVMERGVKRMVDASLKYNISGKDFQFTANDNLKKEIEDILLDVEKDIFNFIYLRSINVSEYANRSNDIEQDNKPFITALLAAAVVDYTLEESIKHHAQKMYSEVEAFVSAGMYKGFDRNRIVLEYMSHINKPFIAPLLLEAYKEGGFKAERIVSKGISFGKGKYVAAHNNFKRLSQDAIYRAYSAQQQNIWNNIFSDYVGWFTVRGSAYPCSYYCDPQIGAFHPKSEFFQGWHSNCVCLLIPVFRGEI